MDEIRFPFPDRALALRELQTDPVGRTLSRAEQETFRDKAWTFGEEAARRIYAKSEGEKDFRTLLQKKGMHMSVQPRDCVMAGRRYFAVYESGKSTVEIYTQAVAMWAEENVLAYSVAENLILSHEYFHYLETRELGYASELAVLPLLRVGPFSLGRKGIRALSEIGAHAFARTYFELCWQGEDPKAYSGETKEEQL